MKAIIYLPNGEIIKTEPQNKTDFTLEELHKIVNGYIEIIYLKNDQIMVVNEEGKLNDLPINKNATAKANLWNDYIVGNALLCNKNQIK